MPQLKLHVPTFYGHQDQSIRSPKQEFDAPFVPVVIRDADGERIVLGSHDYWDADAPDLQIERRAAGWVIFLRPVGGGDQSGAVFFLDDGRSFVAPENPAAATPPIQFTGWSHAIAKVDLAQDTNQR
jgi:hypothetical protein